MLISRLDLLNNPFVIIYAFISIIHIWAGNLPLFNVSDNIAALYRTNPPPGRNYHKISFKTLASGIESPETTLPPKPQKTALSEEADKTIKEALISKKKVLAKKKDVAYDKKSHKLGKESAPKGLPGKYKKPGFGGPGTKQLTPNEIKRNYLAELAKEIERRKVFPPEAMKRNQSGTVKIFFTILRDGTIRGIDFKERTRYPLLDIAAIKLLSGIGKFKPLPEGLKQTSLGVAVAIEYSLIF